MAPFRIKKETLEPGLKLLFKRRGVEEDVSGETVTATMYRRGDRTTGGIVFTGRACINVTGETNAKLLAWQSGDTDTAGNYEIEINIDYGSGRDEVAPQTVDIKIYE